MMPQNPAYKVRNLPVTAQKGLLTAIAGSKSSAGRQQSTAAAARVVIKPGYSWSYRLSFAAAETDE